MRNSRSRPTTKRIISDNSQRQYSPSGCWVFVLYHNCRTLIPELWDFRICQAFARFLISFFSSGVFILYEITFSPPILINIYNTRVRFLFLRADYLKHRLFSSPRSNDDPGCHFPHPVVLCTSTVTFKTPALCNFLRGQGVQNNEMIH